jgi:hypothetical protein
MKKECRRPTARWKTGCDEALAGARKNRGVKSGKVLSPLAFVRVKPPEQASGRPYESATNQRIRPGTSFATSNFGRSSPVQRANRELQFLADRSSCAAGGASWVIGVKLQIALDADAVVLMVAKEIRSLRALKHVSA